MQTNDRPYFIANTTEHFILIQLFCFKFHRNQKINCIQFIKYFLKKLRLKFFLSIYGIRCFDAF